MTEVVRPHLDRRRHQAALRRARARRRRRRRVRMRRVRLLRALRTLRFWTRAGMWLAGLAAVSFWAKFAVVYDIPPVLQQGPLTQVEAYVTVKPWWFGPPAFDLGAVLKALGPAAHGVPPMVVVLDQLGRYQAVLREPRFVWVKRASQP